MEFKTTQKRNLRVFEIRLTEDNAPHFLRAISVELNPDAFYTAGGPEIVKKQFKEAFARLVEATFSTKLPPEETC
jgi:hypothetical protein